MAPFNSSKQSPRFQPSIRAWKLRKIRIRLRNEHPFRLDRSRIPSIFEKYGYKPKPWEHWHWDPYTFRWSRTITEAHWREAGKYITVIVRSESGKRLVDLVGSEYRFQRPEDHDLCLDFTEGPLWWNIRKLERVIREVEEYKKRHGEGP